jgi:hypothetical protein
VYSSENYHKARFQNSKLNEATGSLSKKLKRNSLESAENKDLKKTFFIYCDVYHIYTG